MLVGVGGLGRGVHLEAYYSGRSCSWPLLPPIFYVWSMHSGGTPIYVPGFGSASYYNTRYGLAALPLLAIAGGVA